MDQKQVSKISWYGVALMTLTSVHHVYGAAIYQTPWRLHILMISVPVVILTITLDKALRKHGRSIVFWLFLLITLVPTVCLIGIFEGVYNHILKNIMFFGGASNPTLRLLFPAPKYEMPNDLFFEATGILQGLLTIPLIIQTIKLLHKTLKKSRL